MLIIIKNIKLNMFSKNAGRKKYKAFISYKHIASSSFAKNFESAIKRYSKPIWQKPMEIFRDEHYIVPGAPLDDIIGTALAKSEYLIYLASPEAALSPWVHDELNIWCKQKSRINNLIVVLTTGQIAYNAITKKIDWNNTNALPEVLRRKITKVPFYIDGTKFKDEEAQSLNNSEFKQAINQIVAKLKDIDPIEMSNQEVLEHRRNIFIRNGMFVAVGCSALIAVFAMWNQSLQRKIAIANEELGIAQSILRSEDPDLRRAASLAIKSIQTSPNILNRETLHYLERHLPKHVWEIASIVSEDEYGLNQKMALSSDGKYITVRNRNTGGNVHNVEDGKSILNITFPNLGSLDKLPSSKFSPSAHDIYSDTVAADIDGQIQIVDIRTGQIKERLALTAKNWSAWTYSFKNKMLIFRTNQNDIGLISFLRPNNIKNIPLPEIEDRKCLCVFSFSENGKYVAISYKVGKQNSDSNNYQFEDVLIYHTENQKIIKRIKNVTFQVKSLHFSPDKNRSFPLIAIQDHHTNIKLYDLSADLPPINITLHSEADQVLFSQDSNLIATSHDFAGKNGVNIFDTKKGRLLARVPVQAYTIDNILFDHKSENIFIAGNRETKEGFVNFIASWQLTSAEIFFSYKFEDRVNHVAITFHPIKNLIAIEGMRPGRDPEFIDIVDKKSGKTFITLRPDPEGKIGFVGASGLRFTDDGKHLVMTGYGHTLFIWQTSDWRLVWQGINPSSDLIKNDMPKKKLPIPIANLKTILNQMRNEGNNGKLLSIVSPNGVTFRVVEGGHDRKNTSKSCTIKSDPTGNDSLDSAISLRPDNGICSQVDSAAFHPSGNIFAVGIIGEVSSKNISLSQLQIWQMATHFDYHCWVKSECSGWRLSKTLPLDGQVITIKFSKSGKYLGVRDNSGQITVIDGNSFEITKIYSGHGGSVSQSAPSIVFSADEKWIATSRGPLGGPARWLLSDSDLISDIKNRLGPNPR
ncbi:MAG: TIR domain-containing protein [Hyphomicrobiales bacterium]